jgi:gas vesicle protein
MKFFTFGILTGLVIAFAAEFLTAPLQSDPLFVETMLTACVPYGA